MRWFRPPPHHEVLQKDEHIRPTRWEIFFVNLLLWLAIAGLAVLALNH